MVIAPIHEGTKPLSIFRVTSPQLIEFKSIIRIGKITDLFWNQEIRFVSSCLSGSISSYACLIAHVC